MSQHDMDLANAAGAAFRSDANAALQALVTLSSGATAPSTTFARMLWADTTSSQLKRRNAANSGWIVLCSLDEAFILSRSSNTILVESDRGKTLLATAGYTQTLTAAATLGDGWSIDIIVDSGATLVIDPNSSETVDGATSKSIVGPASGKLVCSGSSFRTAGFEIPPITITAEQASTSGTSIDFTNIPPGTKRITVMFSAVTTNGTSPLAVQIGDAGGIENSGYASGAMFGASVTNSSAAFIATQVVTAADVYNGKLVLDLQKPSTFRWISTGLVGDSSNGVHVSQGAKSLSAELDRVRITTVGGVNTFDGGAISISYE